MTVAGLVSTGAGLLVPATALAGLAPSAPSFLTLRGEGRVWHRDPDPAWVAALRATSPHSTEHSWLHLAWEPGDTWEPVERWMLYQVTPRARVRPEVLAELEGPDPRSTGHYCGPTSLCGCHPNRRPDLWVGGLGRLINHTEWRLYRATGGWARAWWVVQGEAGGHPRYFTPAEAALAELAGLESEPPVPGALAYADPDARTWAAVQHYDRAARGARLLEHRVDEMVAEERADAVAVRRATLEMLRRSAAEAVDAFGTSLRRELSDVRLGAFAHDPAEDAIDYDAEDDAFVHDVD